MQKCMACNAAVTFLCLWNGEMDISLFFSNTMSLSELGTDSDGEESLLFLT